MKNIIFISFFLMFKMSAQNIGLFKFEGKMDFNRFYTINYNQQDKGKPIEFLVENKDSIAIMQAEFKKIAAEIIAVNKDKDVDTISKYKLKFVKEFYKMENIGRSNTYASILKKCNQQMDLKSFIDRFKLVSSYSKKYVIVDYIMPFDIGNTYTRSGAVGYYFEKMD